MANGSDRSLKFYCPTHRIRFQAPGQTVIPCERGGHTVGSGFPASSWWEFCCDCGTFWPANPANGSLQRTECLVCERPVAKRYLCTTCQVVSIESSALVRRKTYSIDSASGITPNCPGCSTTAKGQLQEHECAEASVRLLTSRSTCPFCDSHLGPHQSVTSEQPAPSASTACPFCGTQQKPGNRFCKRCGKPQPEAAAEAKAREDAVRRKAEEAAARQKAAEARRQATAEALRLAEEKRRRDEEVKRKAKDERLRAEETRRRKEEQQRLAKELQRSVEEEAVRRAAEEEARKQAEQEQQRVNEAQRQQEEHERLASELHRRAKDEEAQRVAEAESPQPEPQVLTTTDPEVPREAEPEKETLRVGATGSEIAQIGELQPVSNVWDEGAGATSEQPTHPSQTDYQAESGASLPVSESELSYQEDSLSTAMIGTAEFGNVPEYTPSWDQPLASTASQPRRLPRLWIAGLLVAAAIGATVTVISLTRRADIAENTNVNRPTPTPTRPGLPVGMILIPGGEFLVGNDAAPGDYERPAHKATAQSFFIDTFEVTGEEYEKFIKATGHRAPSGWPNGTCPIDAARKPVTGVDWDAASAYAAWARKRLPTEEEWELAARSTDGRTYPWGNEWRLNVANVSDSHMGHVVDVGSYPEGKSPFGVMDMVGNAWEWTASELVPYPGGKLPRQPPGELRVIRGGSWESDKTSATTSYRWGWPARGGRDYRNTGFRCAKDVTR